MQGLCSEYQAGFDYLVRCVHVQSAYYEHERRRNPVHAYRRSVVWICGLRREEEADFQHVNLSSLLTCMFSLLLNYLIRAPSRSSPYYLLELSLPSLSSSNKHPHTDHPFYPLTAYTHSYPVVF